MAKENLKTCPNDCLQCSPQQRMYCSAQNTRLLIDMMEDQRVRFRQLEEKVDSLSADDSKVFNPMAEENQPKSTADREQVHE